MMNDVHEVERVQMLGSSQRFFEFLESHLSASPYRIARMHASRRAQAAVPDSLVSIVVPLAGDKPAVARTVAAALAQAHPNLEVLLVGSSGVMSAIALSRTDPRLRVITARSDTITDCLNAGLDNARGDYISFCRPGVTIAPDCILRRLVAMQRLGATVGYDGGPGARDLTAHDVILGFNISLESVFIHRSVVDEGTSFQHLALDMSDSAALLGLARFNDIVSLCRDPITCRPSP
jgi:glycosyltransferase involved in cell wall biosynthesis